MTTTEQQLATAAVPESFPEVVLTLAEAAWAAGLTREQLQEFIHGGELRVRRVVRAGRLVAVVAMSELECVHRAHAYARHNDREATTILRERIARLEGELKSSERVERSLQRYADKLEERSALRIGELEQTLAISRKREMTLARALGRAEGQVMRLAARVALTEEVPSPPNLHHPQRS